jgi:hypothetical protein
MQINHAIEVASILRHNIVQGARSAEDENAKWGTYTLPFYFKDGCCGLGFEYSDCSGRIANMDCDRTPHT